MNVVVAGRNEARLAWLRTAARARTLIFEGSARFETDEVDMMRAEELAALIARHRPKVVVQAASAQPASVIAVQGNRWSRLVAEAGLSVTAVFQAQLSLRVLEAMQGAGHEAQFVNCCFPDVVNALLSARGHSVACGIGNVGILGTAFAAEAGENGVRVLAHYQTITPFRSAPETRTGPFPRVWIGEEEIGDVGTRFRRVQLTPEPALDISGACGVPLLLAMAAGTAWRGHVPGPNGLVGGYPVGFDGRRVGARSAARAVGGGGRGLEPGVRGGVRAGDRGRLRAVQRDAAGVVARDQPGVGGRICGTGVGGGSGGDGGVAGAASASRLRGWPRRRTLGLRIDVKRDLRVDIDPATLDRKTDCEISPQNGSELMPTTFSARMSLLAGSFLISTISASVAAPTNYSLLTTIPITPNPLTSFDISYVDPLTGIYYFADRSNKSVDIINGATNKLIGQAGGFVGLVPAGGPPAPGGTAVSGPDGVVVVNSGGIATLYAGDGGSTLRSFNVNNPAAPVAQGTVPTGGGVFRVDEMAYSPATNQIFAANNANSPAFASLINATPPAPSLATGHILVPGQVNSGGLEQPVWDPNVGNPGSFFVSVPTLNGTDAGGVQQFNSAGVAGNFINFSTLGISACSPAGLALGASGNLMVGCGAANTQTVVIDPATGMLVATLPQVSSSDELWYDPASNDFFVTGAKAGGDRVIDIFSDFKLCAACSRST